MKSQTSFLPDNERWPPGLIYLEDFISEAEEENLLLRLQEVEYSSFKMRGVESKRKIAHFGMQYDFLNRSVSRGEKIPTWLLTYKIRAEEVLKKEVSQILATYYPAGSSIGWHFDAPPFESLLGISLLNPCLWKMRKGKVRHWQTFELGLAPRSAYAISGEARWLWEHHIPAVKADRYSLTFRTLVAKV